MGDVKELSPDIDPKTVEVREATVSGLKEIFPQTRGKVKALIDGRNAFSEMYDRLSHARKYVYISIWYIPLLEAKPTLLKGNHKFTDVLHDLAEQGVKIRILLSFFDPQILPLFFPDAKPAAEKKEKLEALDRKHKNITVLVARHPHKLNLLTTTIVPGTFHEKLLLIDGKYAFCGGLEFTPEYNESDTTHEKSLRHDVHTLIQGPVVKQFERHFVTRWREVKGPKDADLPDPTDNYEPNQDLHAVQIAITKSKDALRGYSTIQQDVLDAYKKAVSEAKEYIYIENQYFRDASFLEALIDQLNAQHALQLIIVLPVAPEEKENPLTRHIDFIQHGIIEKLRAVDNTRVGIYSVRRPRGGDIYVHSKMMIIDDKWVTIGSANINPRGFFLDAEANIVIRDEEFAKNLRLDLWAEHLQVSRNSVDIPSNGFIGVWNQQAKENDARIQKKLRLKGRVHTHVPKKGMELDLHSITNLIAGGDPVAGAILKALLPDINKYI